VWYRGAAKQRLWLGTRQYRDGCRNAAPNAAATNAYAYSDGDAMRAWNTYAYSDSNNNSNSNSNSNGYPYGYGNCNAHSERNTDADTNIYGHANRLAYGYAQGDTKASADSVSSTDPAVILIPSLPRRSLGKGGRDVIGEK
jgi:hypothetical protein